MTVTAVAEATTFRHPFGEKGRAAPGGEAAGGCFANSLVNGVVTLLIGAGICQLLEREDLALLRVCRKVTYSQYRHRRV
jgi:hypothetical protein